MRLIQKLFRLELAVYGHLPGRPSQPTNFFLTSPINNLGRDGVTIPNFGCYRKTGKRMRKEIRDEINRAHAERSTDPKTTEGKQRSAMNAFHYCPANDDLVAGKSHYCQ